MTSVLVLAAVTAAVLGTVAGWHKHRHQLPLNRVRNMHIRLRLRMRAGRGFTPLLQLWLRWGRPGVLRKSSRTRPSLGFWHRLGHLDDCSILVGWAQWWYRLRISLEEHVLVVSPPREGKTGWLARVILRYPGPVLSTTTKADVYGLTAAVRAGRGPVAVFNPQNIGGVASTFAWDPIAGCQNPATAIRRADAITQAVSLEGTDDATFWTTKASSYMRAMFYAAALAGYDLRAVVRWITDSAEEAEDILRQAAGAGDPRRDTLTQAAARQWSAELRELRGEAVKTAATITMVLSRALSFMTDPALAVCVLPDEGWSLSIPDFLRDRGTIYLIADTAAAEAPLAPVFAAFASEVHWIACQLGQASAGGRLDPPLLMALDEVTQICPVPLPVWLADSGGKGIQVIAVAHGDAQLAARWKDEGRRIIADTCSLKLYLPGVTDVRTLQDVAALCGDAAYRERGQDHYTRHPAATPDMIRQLPDRRALAIRSKYAASVAKLPMAWKDRLYKKARRHGWDIPSIPAGLAQPEPAMLTLPDHLPAPADFSTNGISDRDATILRGPWDAPEQPWWTR